MDRQEAAKVLSEILSECNGSLLMSSVSISHISPNKTAGSSFELKINCELDDYLRKCINAVLERHKLAIRELANSVIIYRPIT
ncbi:MAG: hypothetical protein ABSA75_05690 [Candidatus Bathyarchaeia archaeon]